MAETSTRDTLIKTARALLWRNGFEAMSPRKVLQESGVGQGSLYHHFSGKKDLALSALDAVSTDMSAEVDAIFDASEPPLSRLHRYLCKDRKGLPGCRLGRLSNETAFQDKDLRKPLSRYFRHLRKRLVSCLAEAVENGDLKPDCDPALLADTLISTIQGGYVLSRSDNDTNAINRATQGLWSLIETQIKINSNSRSHP